VICFENENIFFFFLFDNMVQLFFFFFRNLPFDNLLGKKNNA